MRTWSQNLFPATLKSEVNTQTNYCRERRSPRQTGWHHTGPSVHLTRQAWSLSLVQCRLSWSHSVIFPFHGPPFPRHPEWDVNPGQFWWSQARAIGPTQNASFSMKVSGEPYFHILSVWSAHEHLWNAAASRSRSLSSCRWGHERLSSQSGAHWACSDPLGHSLPPCFLPDSKKFLSGLTAAVCVRDYGAVDSWCSNPLIQMDGKHREQSVYKDERNILLGVLFYCSYTNTHSWYYCNCLVTCTGHNSASLIPWTHRSLKHPQAAWTH